MVKWSTGIGGDVKSENVEDILDFSDDDDSSKADTSPGADPNLLTQLDINDDLFALGNMSIAELSLSELNYNHNAHDLGEVCPRGGKLEEEKKKVTDLTNIRSNSGKSMDSIIAGLSAATGFAALQIANDYILEGYGMSCLCPPLGAVAILLFCLPGAPASQPKAVLGAHIIAGVIGYAVVQSSLPYGEAIAVALTITAMSAAKMVHPPAGAYAFLFVNKGMGLKGIYAGLIGSAVLVATQIVFNSTVKSVISGKKKNEKIP